MQRPKLSGIVLSQDSAATLGPVLDQLSSVCDEIVVVDGGSSDRTVEIAASRPAVRLFHRAFDSFHAQRNFSLDQARGEWVLILDCDELLGPRTLRWLPWLLRVPFINWYSFPRYWLVEQEGEFKYIASEPYYRDRQPRLFKNRPTVRYDHGGDRIHERLNRDDLGLGRALRRLHIFHYVFLLESRQERQIKFNKYQNMDSSRKMRKYNQMYLWEDRMVTLSTPKEAVPGDLRSPNSVITRDSLEFAQARTTANRA